MGKDDEKKLDLALRIANKKIETQNLNHNSLESKIGILLGFVSILFASAIALLQDKLDLLGLNIFTIGIVGLFITLIFLVLASKSRIFLDPPDFSTFYTEKSLNLEIEEIKNQVVADIKESFNHNNNIQNLKSKMYNSAIFCLIASLLFLFLGIIEK